MTATVKYRIGTYQGTITVNCQECEDAESIIARAKALLKKRSGGYPLGLYSESYKIVKQTENLERSWFDN